MKKVFVFMLLFVIFTPSMGQAFDYFGYRSPAPFGVFSVMSTRTPLEDRYSLGVSFEKTESPDYYRYAFQLAAAPRDGIEIGLSAPYVQATDKGFEDLSLGLKHRILGRPERGLSFAYFLGAGAPLRADAYSTEGGITAGAILSDKLGPFKSHLNVLHIGHADDDMKNEVSVGLGFAFAAARGLSVLAEFYGRKFSSDDDLSMKEARFGYRFSDEEGFYTTIGIGIGMNSGTPDFRIIASIARLIFERDVEIIEEEAR